MTFVFVTIAHSGCRTSCTSPFALVTKTEIVNVLPHADGIPSRLQLVATLHVTALEPLNTAGAA